MTTLESLTTEELAQKLADPEIQDRLDFDIDMILSENSVGTSFKTLKKLESAINQTKLSPDIRSKYSTVLVQLKFSALPKLKQEEIIELLSGHLLTARDSSFDVGQRISTLFFGSSQSDYKKVDWLLRSLESNNELLVKNITLGDGKQVSGTIGNLIRLYKNSPYFKEGGSLGTSSFFGSDKNMKNIDKAAVGTWREILSLYEWIRLKAIPKGSIGNYENRSPSFSTNFTASMPSSSVPPTPAPKTPPAEMTAFEKKLANMSSSSSEPAHGEDLEALKHRIEEAKKPKIVSKPAPTINMDEIRREVNTPELPAHKEAVAMPKPVAPKPVMPKLVPPRLMVPKPVVPLKSLPPLRSLPPRPIPHAEPAPVKPNAPTEQEVAALGKPLAEINSMDDLKNIDVKHFRQGPLASQLALVKIKILELSKKHHVLPFYAVVEFEKSPLFKAYLKSGERMMIDGKLTESEMTQAEFEAVADLKKHIEAL